MRTFEKEPNQKGYDMSMAHDGWRKYDNIAAVYDRIMVPHFFIRPAQDLFSMLSLPRGAGVLDIGTGTGVGALLAIKNTGQQALVVGLDSSTGMLKQASKKGLSKLVNGTVPGLPFQESSFDGVLVNFVINHTHDYRTAMVDMIRVLRPRGKLGLSVWDSSDSEVEQAWQSVADGFIEQELVRNAVRQAIPWEAYFSNPDNILEAVRNAGLEKVNIIHKDYEIKMFMSDYLEYKNHTLSGRFIANSLEVKLWEQFQQKLANELERSFGDQVNFIKRVHLAAGAKP